MSLKDRFVDGVSQLFDKLNDGEGLSGVEPAVLERELARRVAARNSTGDPASNPIAKLVGAGTEAQAARAALAEKRTRKIHGKRAKEAAAEKKARDAAFADMAREAERNPPRTPPRSSTTGTSRPSGGPRRRPSIFQDRELAKHYKTLDLDYGADVATAKKAYRMLMRKYHPDRHQDEKKKKAATTLAIKISAAFAAIEAHHKR